METPSPHKHLYFEARTSCVILKRDFFFQIIKDYESVEVFKTRLAKALCSLVEVHC